MTRPEERGGLRGDSEDMLYFLSSHHFSCSTGVADRDNRWVWDKDVRDMLSLTSFDLQAEVLASEDTAGTSSTLA